MCIYFLFTKLFFFINKYNESNILHIIIIINNLYIFGIFSFTIITKERRKLNILDFSL